MGTLARHWPRIAITLAPLVFALLHAVGALPIGFLNRLDAILYDARLRASMPRSMDPRVVIVDIDEKSLAEVGRWPWGRNKLAAMLDELFERQQVALVGFDVVFAEPDESSGLQRLRELAQADLRDAAGFRERVAQLQSSLDYDASFARALQKRPAVLGYYLTSERDARKSGLLPAPVMTRDSLKGRPIAFYSFQGYGSNIPQLAQAAPVAGYFNSITDGDGVVRSIPLLAEYGGAYYESLALAMFRVLAGHPAVEPGFPREHFVGRSYPGLDSVLLKLGSRQAAIPVDDKVAVLVPFRGPGGPMGGSFRYVSASDLIAKRLPAGALKDKIVLVGTTAPGLLDLRVTPVGATYPGVEVHANAVSGLLEGRLLVKPDYAMGYEVVVLMVAGLALAFLLPMLSATVAVLVSSAVMTGLLALNYFLFNTFGLVLPLASALVMAGAAFALNMSYGYFVESRSKRELANLFGTYVPPELVDEMVKDPDSYSMKASNKELTVMFCDMRGFTSMSERMEPTQLQELLNAVFSQLTEIIRANRGTIDKYMGDCVMAFWGAPVETPMHAQLAVKTALQITQAVRAINQEHRAKGIPDIGVGIGLNTGTMCVGDMGSDVRRSYTVIGDAVNLGSRLEGLCKVYGVDIVASESTRQQAREFSWLDLDRVRVKGKQEAVAIFHPLGPSGALDPQAADELRAWGAFLQAYRAQDWEKSELQLVNLQRLGAKKYLYELYAQRVASMRLLPFDPGWDGATQFETK
ncbi:adenylate/guanylate cyclase domain-containing protein [Ramlibacter ginsenosidimutans]|uniref:Adenylate/guanylate cyclase domain-containing protein n=1 Tax=Ramlibacter ginsenosidimutans TaxID=502333 RepID=A0A934TQL0_9BURK|nr:adenylate/guanylate cyclase domain-containing protein [Ramlibacter ginsenosidimutans]MBK6005756.1 adenylate/guanylate cyclase domain-containing protein [Ramlibacter ginsenosidimutans]